MCYEDRETWGTVHSSADSTLLLELLKWQNRRLLLKCKSAELKDATRQSSNDKDIEASAGCKSYLSLLRNDLEKGRINYN